MLRRCLVLTGNVQGVGLRISAKYLADRLNLLGSVKNLEDGSVVIFIQGNEVDIENFVKLLNKISYIDIENIKSLDVPLDENLHNFKILY